MKYLGMIIGENLRRSEFWKPIVDKIKNRLSRWKGRMLSMAGRISPIKSVISALPFFTFPSSKHLQLSTTKSKEYRQSFFWGGDMKEEILPG